MNCNIVFSVGDNPLGTGLVNEKSLIQTSPILFISFFLSSFLHCLFIFQNIFDLFSLSWYLLFPFDPLFFLFSFLSFHILSFFPFFFLDEKSSGFMHSFHLCYSGKLHSAKRSKYCEKEKPRRFCLSFSFVFANFLRDFLSKISHQWEGITD